jgi:hypothetical protein
VVDKARLRSAVQHALRRQPQITLRELLDAEPCSRAWPSWWPIWSWPTPAMAATRSQGLRALVDEAVEEPIRWQAATQRAKP